MKNKVWRVSNRRISATGSILSILYQISASFTPFFPRIQHKSQTRLVGRSYSIYKEGKQISTSHENHYDALKVPAVVFWRCKLVVGCGIHGSNFFPAVSAFPTVWSILFCWIKILFVPNWWIPPNFVRTFPGKLPKGWTRPRNHFPELLLRCVHWSTGVARAHGAYVTQCELMTKERAMTFMLHEFAFQVIQKVSHDFTEDYFKTW